MTAEECPIPDRGEGGDPAPTVGAFIRPDCDRFIALSFLKGEIAQAPSQPKARW
jgi:hypothetical protein